MVGAVREPRLRISDLARTAGVSVQQVRNYVDLGLLPPVERTPSGYRVFTPDHAEALRVVRSMAEGHGWKRTHAIMRAVGERDMETALAAVDESHAELSRERADIAQVLEAFSDVVANPGVTGVRRAARTASKKRDTGCTTKPNSAEPTS